MSNTTTTFAGFLKTKYAQRLVNTVPEAFVLTRDAPFAQARKIGEQYQQAVITKLEQGGTYSAAGAGAFSLNAATAGQISKALVDSAQFVLKSAIDYETLSKAVSKGDIAYGSAADQLLKNMALSARKRLEIDLWAGQYSHGLGEIDTGYPSGQVIQITEATWAPGFWVGMEGAACEFYATGFGTKRTNTTTYAEIESVDIANRRITFDGTPAIPTDVVATDQVIFKGQRYDTSTWSSFKGLLAIGEQTSGNLFNIAVTNSIWGPEQYGSVGSISFSVLQDAAVTSVVKGLDNGATVYVPVKAWADLLTEQAALRRYGGSFDGRTRLTNGGRAIEFLSLTGTLEIKPSIYCPQGTAVIVPKDSLVRVGATDVTFKVPGMDQTMMQVSDTTAGVSLFCYYNQALFTAEPGQMTLLTGITYT